MIKNMECANVNLNINTKLRDERLEVLSRIMANERLGGDNFFNDVENDPPSRTIMPKDVDYLAKKLSTKIKRKIAGFIAKRYESKVVKDFNITVIGAENLKGISGGAIITSNHFSIYENVAVHQVVKKMQGNKGFYKIVKEGNYFMPGIFGFLLKYERTLPLSSNVRTMINLNKAVDKLLKDGNKILIYPEQSMWWNYKKPRPYKIGAFKYAASYDVPIVPLFIAMTDKEEIDKAGFNKKSYTVRIMPPIFADKNLSVKENALVMMNKNYELSKKMYERMYGEKLTYLCEDR